MSLTLPISSSDRKRYPVGDGCLAYFPAAIAGVAKHSYLAGAKHTGGALVHKRWLSGDHSNCIERHLMDLRDMNAARSRGVTEVLMPVYNFDLKLEEIVAVPIDDAILNETNALAWRALALSQEVHEQLDKVPLAPAARQKEGDQA